MSDNQARKDKVFELIVRAYIETAEPVGSRMISRRSDLGLSSASIRNVMADLEEEGLLAQPHTSAGRVPTDKGYRYYVDRLMEREELHDDEKAEIRAELDKAKSIDGMALKVSKLISELTENTALIYIQGIKRISFLSGQNDPEQARKLSALIDEAAAELFIDGAFRMFEQPEFQDSKQMRLLLQTLDDKDGLVRVFVKDLSRDEGLRVHIGSENAPEKLDNLSLVVKDCHLGLTPFGAIAVVGPKRMRYARIVSVVEFVADTVSEKMKRI